MHKKYLETALDKLGIPYNSNNTAYELIKLINDACDFNVINVYNKTSWSINQIGKKHLESMVLKAKGINDKTKICKQCNQELSLKEFRSIGTKNYHSRCLQCRRSNE